MAANAKQFLVSVADVVIRDTIADQIVLKGKTLISSALQQAINNQEVRGGFGNALQYVYAFEKKLTATIEDSRFDESYIALNSGVSIVNAAKEYYTTDASVTLSSGVGTLASTPVGNVYVLLADGSSTTVTPSGATITVVGGGNTTVKATYRSNETVDFISIDAENFPRAYELVMTAKIFQGTGQTAELQIVVPQFKITGNFDLNFTANGVSTSKLDGQALVDSDGKTYAKIYIKPVNTATITYQAIAAVPGAIALSSSATTQQLSVYGIRGGVYSNVVVTGGCTFASSDATKATVNSSGLVTRAAAGTTTITIAHTASGLTDTVLVTVS